MTVVYAGRTLVTLEPGLTMTVTSSDIQSSGVVRRVLSATTTPVNREQKVPPNTVKIFGPYPEPRNFSIEVTAGKLNYVVDMLSYDYATDRGNIESFTGSFTLKSEDMGKVFRCEDASNVTVTVPASLLEGFNCGFSMWSTGTVTIAAAAGATNRSTKSALSTQYQVGSLLVMKNPVIAPATLGAAAEYTLGGDFS